MISGSITAEMNISMAENKAKNDNEGLNLSFLSLTENMTTISRKTYAAKLKR